jgi:putative ABC transport system permease protein
METTASWLVLELEPNHEDLAGWWRDDALRDSLGRRVDEEDGWMFPLFYDARIALRGVARSPRFAAMATLTIGFGIAAAVAVFTLVNAVLLRPPPFRDPEALVQIDTVRGGERGKISMREIDDLRERLRTVEEIAAYVPGSQYSLAGAAAPEKASAILASHNLARVLGVRLLYGDTFPDSFDRERHNALVLSYGIWRRQFGGDPSIVGRTIVLDASPGLTPSYTVTGVMPPTFDFPARTDLYRSLFISAAFPDLERREARNVIGIARLRAGTGLQRAQQEIALVSQQLAREFPATNEAVTLAMTPLVETVTGSIRPHLLLLLGAVATVFLMALVNVANLFFSRALDRAPQLAVRRALGATRGQIVRQILVEGAILSIAGGAVGVLLARAFLVTFVGMVRLDLPSWIRAEIDTRVLLFAIVLSVVAGIASALLPALHTTAGADVEALRGATRAAGGTRQRRLRRMLLVAEISVAVLLLVSAALMLQTFRALQKSDVGFQPGGLLTFKVALPVYYTAAQQRQFQLDLLGRLEALPGAKGAAVNANLPFANLGQADRQTVIVDGQDPSAVAANPYVNYERVGGRYFDVLGIPIARGRAFGDDDRDGGQMVAIVSDRFARQFWPGQEAVGKRIRRPGPDRRWLVVVGVAGDARHESIAAGAGFDVYLPAAQWPQSWNHFVVRASHGDPMALADGATRAVWAINPQQPVGDVQSMRERMLDTAWQQRASAFLLGVFAVLALTLASVGIYGVTSYVVGQRAREFGVRRALGAQRSDLLRAVLGETGVTAGLGVAIGLVLAGTAAQAIRPLLYGVAALDGLTFVGVPLLLSVVALAASIGPARRAARVDPLTALRSD